MYKIIAADNTYEVTLDKQNPNKGTVNGTSFSIDNLRDGERFHVLKDNKSYSVEVVSANYDEKSFELMVNGRSYAYNAKDRFDLLLKELGMENLASAAVNDLKAPMPGLVLKLSVAVGDTVKKGDPLLVLEAMKMENVLKAAADGVVKQIDAEIGKAVEKNQVLIHFEV
jgi:biotin carboxyl carrier protein